MVEQRSRGRFKVSALGAYERGERTLSIERFCELAQLYGIPPDRLLARVLLNAEPEGGTELVIDLTRLGSLPEERARLVGEYVHRIRSERGDFLSDVITLRGGDLQVLAMKAGTNARRLRATLEPILRIN